MAKIISNVELTQTFSAWVDKTNEMASSFANVVSVDGFFPIGTAGVNGDFRSNTLTVTTGLLTANASANVIGNVAISVAANIGANVTANTSTLFVGNSSVNATHNSILIQIANSTSTSNLTAAGLTVGTSVINTTSVASGANVYLTTTTLFAGNSSVNASHTSALVQVANSTSTANLTAAGLTIGTIIANTTGLFVGANVAANTSALLIGNSSVNTIISSSGIDTDGALSVLGVATLSSNVSLANTRITANGGVGLAGQILTSGGTSGNVYWSTVSAGGGGTITSITGGDGLSGAGVSGDVTIDVGAGNGISVNASAVAVLANSGIIANSTGVFVNANSGIIANTSGVFVNASSIADGTLPVARGGTGVTTANGTGSVIRQTDAVFLANTTITRIVANNSLLGDAGQVLTSGGAGNVYWSTVSGGGGGDITAVNAGDGLTGGGTAGDVSVSVLANSGIIANSSGVFVNASSIAIGTLPVGRGGTGATTFTSGALLKGNGTSAVSNASAADIVAAIGTTRVANATYADSAGSATNATRATNSNNSLVVDDTTTSGTFYPVWVGGTSGDQAIKVSSTKLSFNPSTGILTATGFSGNGASLTTLDAGNIGSGTLAIARGGTGTTSSTGTGSVVLSASPTLTGTPAAPTAAADTNTTQLATTAYVIGQGYLKSATASSTYLPLAGGTVSGNLIVSGNLTVDGTTTTINSTTISVDDKNIELGNTASPSDASADGGGITLKGTSDKTFNWVDATDAWTSSEHLNLLTGKSYFINGTSVLSSSTLGSGVTGSSLTSVGTIGTGVWQGTAVGVLYGGTGATSASGARTNLGATTLGGNIFTITNPSAITFPRFNADNTISALSATDFRTAVGAGVGTVTSVASGNGITGGTITSTGTLSVVANSGIVANTTGVFVNANSGIVANTTGVFVNANSGIVANTTGVFVNANSGIVANTTGVFVNANSGIVANSTGVFVNASSVSVGTLPVAQGGTGVTTSTGTGSVVLSASPTFSGNVLGIEESLTVALSDETTTITTGTAKLTFRAPFAWTLTKIPRASLSTVSSSGTPTVDINVNGSTILSTKLTIDANETTSTTAATAAVLSSTTVADDSEITLDIDVAGTGAKGLKVTIFYKRAS